MHRWLALALGASSTAFALVTLALGARLTDDATPPTVGLQASAVIAVTATQAIALQTRHTHPVRAYLIATTTSSILLLLLQDRTVAVTLTYLASIFFIALHDQVSNAAPAVLLGLSVDFATQCWIIMLADGEDGPGSQATFPALASSFLNIAITYSVCLSTGSLYRLLRNRATEMHRKLARAGREREKAAREAVEFERRRMARELHDVTAHHLSAIIMHARLAALEDPDPQARHRAIASILDQASRSLASMRQIVAIRQVSDDTSSDDPTDAASRTVPQQGIADIPDIIHSLKPGIGAVRCDVGTGLDTVPDALQLATYRIVQESVSNAVRHAGGSDIAVAVHQADDALCISVRNTASLSAPPISRGFGLGIAGMHERVKLLGGDLRTGPTVDGGWLVEARLTLPAHPEVL